jgi:hypothetical protein
MTEEACAASARVTQATAMTWVEDQAVPGEDMDQGDGC